MMRRALGLSIRAKMLLMSCVLLAIPWIGFRYTAEIESILLVNQAEAVSNTARAIATALNDRPSLFQSPIARDADASMSIVAHRLSRPIELDGRSDDWLNQGVELRALGREHVIELAEDIEVAPITLWHALGVYDNDIYALLEVIDERVLYVDAEHPRAENADHVRIGIQTPWGELRRYIVAAPGPGPVSAVQVPIDASASRAMGL